MKPVFRILTHGLIASLFAGCSTPAAPIVAVRSTSPTAANNTVTLVAPAAHRGTGAVAMRFHFPAHRAYRALANAADITHLVVTLGQNGDPIASTELNADRLSAGTTLSFTELAAGLYNLRVSALAADGTSIGGADQSVTVVAGQVSQASTRLTLVSASPAPAAQSGGIAVDVAIEDNGGPTPVPSNSPTPSDVPSAAPGTRHVVAPAGYLDLLSDRYNWRQFSGASWDGSSLAIVPLDRKIRPKYRATGKWYQDPPINLRGPRLDFADGFDVSVSVDTSAHPDKHAYVDLYGSLPIGYDEWRIDGHFVRFALASGVAEVWVDFKKQPFSKSGRSSTVTFTLQKRGGSLSFGVDGEEIGRLDGDPVFGAGKLYFGADAELGGGFAINGIAENRASVADNGAELIRSYPVPATGLRAIAATLRTPLAIGTAAHASALLSDPRYGQTLAQNFSMITPELNFKFQAIHPQPDRYAFAEADALVDFANKNNMRIHGHTLVWHEALPEWVWDLYRSHDDAGLHTALMNHITTVVNRYKADIHEWDTLNEIFSVESDEPYGLRSNAEAENVESLWYKTFKQQIYIDALRKVKEVDPSAENWINDFGIDQASSKAKLDNMIAFVNDINQPGRPRLIDGIGFQTHIYDPATDPAKAAELEAAMKAVVNRTGIKVRVAELDVSGASSRPEYFADTLQACLNTPNCSAFGMWGFTDLYGSMASPANGDSASNANAPNWGAQTVDGLLFDEHYAPKSAVGRLSVMLQSTANRGQ